MKPEVAVGAVVVRSSPHGGTPELLLVERGRGAGVGRWSVPGGRVEAGERLVDAVVREVAEETGLRIRVERFLGWSERIDASAGYHYVILDFVATATDPEAEPVPGDDAAAAAWWPLADLAAAPLVTGLAEFLAEHGIVPA
jgi:ADP-ribose pyrophosphatase YjhB (NUDIX family)